MLESFSCNSSKQRKTLQERQVTLYGCLCYHAVQVQVPMWLTECLEIVMDLRQEVLRSVWGVPACLGTECAGEWLRKHTRLEKDRINKC